MSAVWLAFDGSTLEGVFATAESAMRVLESLEIPSRYGSGHAWESLPDESHVLEIGDHVYRVERWEITP